MNSHEKIIGEMLNNEQVRIQKAKYINLSFILDKNLNLLAQALMQDDFNFVNLYKRYGHDITCFAIEFSNNYAKYTKSTTGSY